MAALPIPVPNVIKTKSLIYAYTGDNSNKTIELFKNVGMNGVFIKPLNINVINKFMAELENKNNNIKFESFIYF